MKATHVCTFDTRLYFPLHVNSEPGYEASILRICTISELLTSGYYSSILAKQPIMLALLLRRLKT